MKQAAWKAARDLHFRALVLTRSDLHFPDPQTCMQSAPAGAVAAQIILSTSALKCSVKCPLHPGELRTDVQR